MYIHFVGYVCFRARFELVVAQHLYESDFGLVNGEAST